MPHIINFVHVSPPQPSTAVHAYGHKSMYDTEQSHNNHNPIKGVAVDWDIKDTQCSMHAYCRQSGSMQCH